MINKIKAKVLKWTERPIKVPIKNDIPTERFGTPYGGWIIPKGILNDQSICYGVGAGEDVSFDAAIAAHYGCKVHIFDPTPRAIAHVEALKNNIANNQKMGCLTSPTGYYADFETEVADRLVLHPFGIWEEDTTLRFYTPQNETHVSHSIVNLQKSDHFIEVPVKSLSSVIQSLGHDQITLLKIDIEGAEYQVLDAMLREQVMVQILCIEYDENASNNLDSKYLGRIEQSLMSLIAAGYDVIAKEPDCHNYTLKKQ